VYETYDSEIIGILDARGPSCPDPSHQPGATVSLPSAEPVGAAATDGAARSPDADGVHRGV